MRIAMIVASMLAFCTAAHAGYSRWDAETNSDPFSGGKKVTLDYTATERSGVVIYCDTAKSGIEVRIMPGYTYTEALTGFMPQVAFAMDGKLLFKVEGETAQVGNNLAASRATLDAGEAEEFAEAFMAARKQIAFNDGISKEPELFEADGSTTSGKALLACIKDQVTSTNKSE